ncbi:MAG: hypothetical protein ACYTJ0_06840 [Planctomycetota bacterium]|jgi:hypothetical protein
MLSRVLTYLTAVIATTAIVGCYKPGGALMPYTGQAITYYSTEVRQATIELIDLRTDDVVFRMDVPPGKQLSIKFLAGDGDDPSLRPDLMQYDVWDIGTTTGRLRNALTVPGAAARRIDVHYRHGREFAEAPPPRELRTDEVAEQPDWWTPEGGPMPKEDRGVTNYDG